MNDLKWPTERQFERDFRQEYDAGEFVPIRTIVTWLNRNAEPEEVFDGDQLLKWAEENCFESWPIAGNANVHGR